MEISLFPGKVPPGSTLTGTLHDAPVGGADVVVYTRTLSSRGRHTLELSTTRVQDGPFEISGPRWPVSGSGPLLTTEWWIEARASSGEIAPAIPFELTNPGTVVESVSNDDLDAPARQRSGRFAIIGGIVLAACIAAVILGSGILRFFGIFVGVIALIAVIGGLVEARQDAVFGSIRCRADVRNNRLDCAVRIHPPDGHPPDDIGITAELRVVEEVTHRGGDDPGTTKSEVAYSDVVTLQRDAHLTWTGSLDLGPTAGLTLSREGADGGVSWRVLWVTRFAVDASGAPGAVRVKPLVARYTGQDAALGRLNNLSIPISAQAER